MTNTFYQHADNLIENGYHVLPIGPGVKWPQEYVDVLDENGRHGYWKNAWVWEQKSYNPDHMRHWPECGIGIKTGEVIAVDIDILDATLAIECANKFEALLGPAALQRVWKAPKRLLLYRTDKPFDKMKMGKIEILAQGQQFVAYGIHPEANCKTTWLNDASPEDTSVSALTSVSEEQVRAALMEINAGLPSEHRGGELKRGVYGQQTDVMDNMVRGTEAGLRTILPFLPNGDLHWDDWNRVGMLIFAATAGSEEGLEMFDQFSKQSPKYDANTTFDRWATLHRSPPKRSPGMRSLCYIAAENGWVDNGMHMYADMKHVTDDDLPKLMKQLGVGAAPYEKPRAVPVASTVWLPPASPAVPHQKLAEVYAEPEPEAVYNPPGFEDVKTTASDEAERIELAIKNVERRAKALEPEIVNGSFKYTSVDENGHEFQTWLPGNLGGGLHPNSPLHKIHENPNSRKSVDATMRLQRVIDKSPTLVEAINNLYDPEVCPEIARYFRAVKSATGSTHALALASGLGVAATVTSAAYRVTAVNDAGRKDKYGDDQTGIYMLVTAPTGVGKNAMTDLSGAILTPHRGYSNYVVSETTGKYAMENQLRNGGRCIYYCSDEAGKKSNDKGNHELTNHEFLLKNYAAKQYTSTSRAASAAQRPFSVPFPALSYAAISTPSDLFNTFSDTAMSGGYANRMLVFPAVLSDHHYKYVPQEDKEDAMSEAASIVDAIAAGAVSLNKTDNKILNMGNTGNAAADLAIMYTNCNVGFSMDTHAAIDLLQPEKAPVLLVIPPESMQVIMIDTAKVRGYSEVLGIEEFSRCVQNAKRVAAVLQRIRTIKTPYDLVVSPTDAKLAVKLVMGCLEAMVNCRDEFSSRSKLVDLADRIMDHITPKFRKAPGTLVSQRDIMKAFRGEEDVPKAIDRLIYAGEITPTGSDRGRMFGLPMK